MTDTNKERAEFEAHYFAENGNRLYCESQWRGWKAHASLAAKAPAAEPVAWPKDAAEVRQFMGSNFICAEFVGSDESPNDDDRYLISAYDFLLAVDWWTGPRHRRPTRSHRTVGERGRFTAA